MRRIAIIALIALAGCVTMIDAPQQASPQAQSAPKAVSQSDITRFNRVVARVEPVAEQQCRLQTRGMNCDFDIVIDERPSRSPNAFQTVDKAGRPILAFNLPLIASVRNDDELAFVMSHEAAHHIEGHLARQRNNAMAGAILVGGLAAITGAGESAVQSATDLGANLGARSYSKDFELEADSLGTVITKKAGYNPVRGAEFFTQIPDPGDRFLGTHPPNSKRMETVRRVNDSL